VGISHTSRVPIWFDQDSQPSLLTQAIQPHCPPSLFHRPNEPCPLSPPLHSKSGSFQEGIDLDTAGDISEGQECSCGHRPSGGKGNRRSNLKRHRETCKYEHDGKPLAKKAKCNWEGCEKRYTREDNLKVHQRSKGHLPIEWEFVLAEVPQAVRSVDAGEHKPSLSEAEPSLQETVGSVS
jgi:hypothetical protein